MSKAAIDRGVAACGQALVKDDLGSVDDGLQEVTKQAIEVWSTTAEIEGDILLEMEDCAATGRQCERENHGFVAKSLELLVPVYLKALLLQKDDFDAEEWTIRKAAACSLELFAHVVKDHILKYALAFVEQNIGGQV